MQAARQAPSSWIVSRRYDLAFFSGSVLVPCLLWALFHLSVLGAVAVYVIFQLCLNMPHNFQTWTMTVLDARDRADHGRRYAVAFVLIAVGFSSALVASPERLYPLLRDALLYWGYYHLVRQHHGFQRLYERRMGGVSPLESKAYWRLLDLVCYAPLVLRWRDPRLMTIDVEDVHFSIRHPVFPETWVVPLLAIYALGLSLAVAHHLWMWRTGRTHLGGRALLLVTVTVAFGVAGLESHVLIAVALLTTFHNLQYLGLVWFHNQTRAAQGGTQGNPLVTLLSRMQLAPYFGVSLLYGVVVFLPRLLVGRSRFSELPVTILVCLHYYVDGRVWRFDLYPERGRWLGMTRN